MNRQAKKYDDWKEICRIYGIQFMHRKSPVTYFAKQFQEWGLNREVVIRGVREINFSEVEPN